MEKASLKIRLTNVLGVLQNNAKLFIKNTIPLVGSFLLLVAGRRVNRQGYKKRILIIFAGGIGDVVKRSVICGYVRKYLSGHEIYYLMPYDITLPYAKETIHFNYKRSKIDPSYYFHLVNQLRAIGFSEVVVLLPAWEGFLGALGKDIRPDRVYRYTEVPPKKLVNAASSLARWFVPRKKVFYDIPFISFHDKRWTKDYWPSDVSRMAKFISEIIRVINPSVALGRDGIVALENARTEVVIDPQIEKDYLEKLKAIGVDVKKCVLIGLGSSTTAKNWPPAKFAESAKYLHSLGMQVALLDHSKDTKLVQEFAATYGMEFLDLGASANLSQVCVLMKHTALVLSNDTSFVHLAVAMRAPSVCVCQNWAVGADSCYGYADINTWVFGDNIETIEVVKVNESLKNILAYLKTTSNIPRERFSTSFFEQ